MDDTVVLPTVDDIRRLVSPGDDILVQVIKDPLGTKGARLTTFVALPSRYLVYMPRGDGIGVSARIDDEAERSRLKEAIAGFIPANSEGRIHIAHGFSGRDIRRASAKTWSISTSSGGTCVCGR